jgi:2-methylcitrate dehydratase PrpD
MEVFHDGAMAKPFQTARAGAAGLLAAELSARGVDGPRTILEGEQGFFAAMCGEREAPELVAGLGEDWVIRGIYFKEHAACRHTHAAVDAGRTLRDEHGLRPEQVEHALVRTYSIANQLCGARELPPGPSEAKFSLPFTIALGLTYGHARQSCFTPEMVADVGLRALASRVSVEVDPALERLLPDKRVSILEVTTTDGRSLRAEVPFPRGEPELPFSDADVEAKFLDNASLALPDVAARAIIDEVRALDERSSCSGLLDLLAGRSVPTLAAR